MGEETIIPEVLDPVEDGAQVDPGGHPRHDQPGDHFDSLFGDAKGPMGGPVAGPDRSPLDRVLGPLKALLFGGLLLAGVAVAVMVGGFIFLIFIAIFFISFLLSGLFGPRKGSTGSIFVEKYGPGGQHEIRFTRIGRPKGPGDPSAGGE